MLVLSKETVINIKLLHEISKIGSIQIVSELLNISHYCGLHLDSVILRNFKKSKDFELLLDSCYNVLQHLNSLLFYFTRLDKIRISFVAWLIPFFFLQFLKTCCLFHVVGYFMFDTSVVRENLKDWLILWLFFFYFLQIVLRQFSFLFLDFVNDLTFNICNSDFTPHLCLPKLVLSACRCTIVLYRYTILVPLINLVIAISNFWLIDSLEIYCLLVDTRIYYKVTL